MSEMSTETERCRVEISLRNLVYYCLKARFMSLFSDETCIVGMITSQNSVFTFAEYLKGRKL